MRRRSLRRLLQDTGGVALVEFALMLPLLATLLIGVLEVSRYVQFNQKVANATNQISNIINQHLNLSMKDVNSIVAAIGDMMAPYPVDGVHIYITAIQQNNDLGPADVMWQVEHGPAGGSMIAPKGKGSKIQLANYTLIKRDQVLAVEIATDYQPVLGTRYLQGTQLGRVYKVALYRPRFGAFQLEPR